MVRTSKCLGDAEFKGYVKATLEDIKHDIGEMKENHKTQIDRCESRFKGLETESVGTKISVAKIMVIVGIVSVVASIIATQVIAMIINAKP